MRAWPVLLLLGLLLSGCSEGNGPYVEQPSAGGQQAKKSATGDGNATLPSEANVTVAAIGAYPVDPSFDPPVLAAPIGAVVHLTFSNKDTVPVMVHNWVVDGIDGAATEDILSGASTTVDFTAPSTEGQHAFYCSIQGHREAGMEGVLIVYSA